jgi:hypothetical protein
LRRRRSTDWNDFPVPLRVIFLGESRVEPKLTFAFGAVKTEADEFMAFSVDPYFYLSGHGEDCAVIGPLI